MTDFMTTYTTPLDRARSLLDELIAFATVKDHQIPTTRYVQVGDIVRDCEAVIVSVNGLVPDALYDPVTCVSPRKATFLVEINRSCSTVFDSRSGLTIPEDLEAVSERAALDGNLLYEFAEQVSGWSSKDPWSVAWSLAEGGLSVSSLQLSIGIP